MPFLIYPNSPLPHPQNLFLFSTCNLLHARPFAPEPVFVPHRALAHVLQVSRVPPANHVHPDFSGAHANNVRLTVTSVMMGFLDLVDV